MITGLLELAHEFDVVPLKDELLQLLGRNINEANVLALLDLAKKYSSGLLKNFVIEYLARRFNDLLVSGTLLQLDLDTWIGKPSQSEVIFHKILSRMMS